MKKITYAPHAWKYLNGVFCIYKPADTIMDHVKNAITYNLCKDLNSMEVRPPETIVKIRGSAEEGTLTVTRFPSLVDNPLVVGPRYQPPDFRLYWAAGLSYRSSGICVATINDGNKLQNPIRKGRFLRMYELTGIFGMATINYHPDGKLMEKTTYDHITKSQVDRILAAWQAAHQKQMFEFAGVSPQSQAAYELAAKGPIRPADKSTPLIYSIKCKEFNPPHFTLEVQCINEKELYLMKLVHELGLTLKSTAVCSKLRRVKYGLYPLEVALVRKHWTLENILNNITHCKPYTDYKALGPEEPHFAEMEASTNTHLERNALPAGKSICDSKKRFSKF